MFSLENRSAILPRSKWWWLGLALLLVLAGWLYLRGLHVSLPFMDQVDEAYHWRAAQLLIDVGHVRDLTHLGYHEGYPPGAPTLNYLFLKHVKPVEAHPVTVVPALRLITIAAWMLLLVMIALLGAMIAHPLTGLMAAAIWLVNPWVVQRAHFVFPDGYLTLFTLLALWLALVGYMHRRRSFSTAAVYSIMLAAVFKTQALFVAPIVLLLPLLNAWRRPTYRQEALQQTFWNMLRFSLFLFWLLLIFPTLEIEANPLFPVDSYGDVALPSLVTAWLGLEKTLLTFQPLASWLVVALIGLLLLRYRRRLASDVLISVALAGLAFLLGISMFKLQSIRQFFVLGAIIALLYSASLTGLAYLVDEALSRLHPLPKRFHKMRTLFPLSLVTALLAISLLPSFRESDALAHNFTLHDRRNDLWSYMDTSLPPGNYISNHIAPYHRLLDRALNSYQGVHDYPLAQKVKGLLGSPLGRWRGYDAIYAIVPYQTEDGEPFLQFPEETFALKHYPTDPNFRDPGMTVLRLYPMQHEAEGQLGSIHLVGYDLSASEVAAGDDIVFRQYWRADKPTNTIHRVGNYLLNDENEVVAQVDYVPLWDARRDTTTWDDPDEILIGREFTLRVPSDLPPAAYQLSFGLYDSTARLLSPEGSDLMEITKITVVPPEV